MKKRSFAFFIIPFPASSAAVSAHSVSNVFPRSAILFGSIIKTNPPDVRYSSAEVIFPSYSFDIYLSIAGKYRLSVKLSKSVFSAFIKSAFGDFFAFSFFISFFISFIIFSRVISSITDSVAGMILILSNLSIERCVVTSKERIESVSLSKNSIRKGFSSFGKKTSRIPPLTENCPAFSTISSREYPKRISFSVSSPISAQLPTDSVMPSVKYFLSIVYCKSASRLATIIHSLLFLISYNAARRL